MKAANRMEDLHVSNSPSVNECRPLNNLRIDLNAPFGLAVDVADFKLQNGARRGATIRPVRAKLTEELQLLRGADGISFRSLDDGG
jgi:hypothetical protein